MDRRKFLIGAGLGLIAASSPISLSAIGQATKRVTKTGRMKLSYMPYELQLRHAFNLAKYSRTTTPDVQVQIELDGIVGYGEASMPPYLGESVESVCKFLSQVDLSQFSDPFRLEEILDYVDGIAPNNRAAKASIDIALHDLLGKIMGQPWYKIWGLSPEEAPNTSFTIGIDKADQDKLFKSFFCRCLSVRLKFFLFNPTGVNGIVNLLFCQNRIISVDFFIKAFFEAGFVVNRQERIQEEQIF